LGTHEGSSGRDVIEHASGQVIGGLNGSADSVNANSQLFGENERAILLPVIFTTAELFCSEVDLGTADVDKGTLRERASRRLSDSGTSITSQPI
jgi:hypothetical protein